MSDFVDRVMADPALKAKAQAGMAKVAGIIEPGNLKTIAGLTAATAIGGALGHTMSEEVTGGYQKLRGALFKKRNFAKMMKENPDLEQLDKRQVQLSFDTLNRLNPTFASDPLVAGTWTRQIAGFGEGVPADRAAQLVSANNQIASAASKKVAPFGDALSLLQADQRDQTAALKDQLARSENLIRTLRGRRGDKKKS